MPRPSTTWPPLVSFYFCLSVYDAFAKINLDNSEIEDPKGHSDAIVAIEKLLQVIKNSEGKRWEASNHAQFTL